MTRTGRSKIIVALTLLASSACNDTEENGIDNLDTFPDAGVDADEGGR